MNTTLDTLSITARTVSPITRVGGEFHWTDYTVEVDEDGPTIKAAHYRTDGCGKGVWCWQTTGGERVDSDDHVVGRSREWKQVTGWSQTAFNCAPGTRRERVLEWLGFWRDGMTARQAYARTDRIPSGLL
jgi:hypothetical protein